MMPATATPATPIAGEHFGTIDVAHAAPLFDEHFEQFPVLPGSFSLTLAIEMLFDALGVAATRPGRTLILRKVNFTCPVLPGERLSAHLRRLQQDGARTTAHVELRDASGRSAMDGILSWEHDA
ncbi:hotdog fold domain-containing protein [Burkholderia alba]|uniref:hotdog fold domain-containing protein n=1 Tax=Burkholderia alba TaxID=2683677 RepID=UPI002B05FF87|nr:hotdog fold domain-containing protein [Burkholderia alba]